MNWKDCEADNNDVGCGCHNNDGKHEGEDVSWNTI